MRDMSNTGILIVFEWLMKNLNIPTFVDQSADDQNAITGWIDEFALNGSARAGPATWPSSF
jgi:hypothetical protein